MLKEHDRFFFFNQHTLSTLSFISEYVRPSMLLADFCLLLGLKNFKVTKVPLRFR